MQEPAGAPKKPSAREREQDRLRRDIAGRLSSASEPEPVNLSRPRHGITTPVLREFVYEPKRFRRRELPVVFDDGSTPPPFPVGRFNQENEPAPRADAQAIRLGLMSFRHPDLDYLVDIYVFRNRELGGNESRADEEALAFARALEVLSDPVADDGAELWLFHTGFEPAVLGFYRAFVEVLERRAERGLPRELLLRPWFYIGAKANPPFTRQSPGATLAGYEPGAPWW